MRLFPLQLGPYMLKLANSVIRIETAHRFNFATIKATFPEIEYPELEVKEGNHIRSIIIRSTDNGSAMLFPKSGKVILVGMISIEDPAFWEARLTKLIPNYLVDRWWDKTSSRIYTGNFNFAINLGKLAAYLPKICTYTPEKFPGCKVQCDSSKAWISVFSDGCFNVSIYSESDLKLVERLLDSISSFTDYRNNVVKSADDELARLFQEKLKLDPEYVSDLTQAMADLKVKSDTIQERVEEYEYWNNRVREARKTHVATTTQ
jgi:TATA-box binding protein (TBP) (component of TFIID and TFIIIB)